MLALLPLLRHIWFVLLLAQLLCCPLFADGVNLAQIEQDLEVIADYRQSNSAMQRRMEAATRLSQVEIFSLALKDEKLLEIVKALERVASSGKQIFRSEFVRSLGIKGNLRMPQGLERIPNFQYEGPADFHASIWFKASAPFDSVVALAASHISNANPDTRRKAVKILATVDNLSIKFFELIVQMLSEETDVEVLHAAIPMIRKAPPNVHLAYFGQPDETALFQRFIDSLVLLKDRVAVSELADATAEAAAKIVNSWPSLVLYTGSNAHECGIDGLRCFYNDPFIQSNIGLVSKSKRDAIRLEVDRQINENDLLIRTLEEKIKQNKKSGLLSRLTFGFLNFSIRERLGLRRARARLTELNGYCGALLERVE